jgi:hypothetical protein
MILCVFGYGLSRGINLIYQIVFGAIRIVRALGPFCVA